jgi:hypothetical protein
VLPARVDWHEQIGSATCGDAIATGGLRPCVHHAHRITLTGGSVRRLAPDGKEPSSEPSSEPTTRRTAKRAA